MNNYDKKFPEILPLIKTKEEANRLLLELETLSDSLYSAKKEGFENALKGSVGTSVSANIKKELQRQAIDISDYQKLKTFLDDLKTKIKALLVMHLTLAFEPSEKILEEIHTWISENISDNILLDITIDSSILGGAVITFKGNYIDYSIKKQLDYTFEHKKKEIVNQLGIRNF